MIKFATSVLVAAAATAPAQSPEDFAKQMSSLGEPARVLALSCVSHTINANDLEQFAADTPAFLRYNEQQAQPFLQGRPGKVWGVRVSDSGYAISLSDSGICSIYAEKADRSRSIDDLKALIGLLYPGGPITRIDGSKHGLDDPKSVFDGWSIYDGRRKVTYWFTAIVPKQDGALAQTVYSVYVTGSEAP